MQNLSRGKISLLFAISVAVVLLFAALMD